MKSPIFQIEIPKMAVFGGASADIQLSAVFLKNQDFLQNVTAQKFLSGVPSAHCFKDYTKRMVPKQLENWRESAACVLRLPYHIMILPAPRTHLKLIYETTLNYNIHELQYINYVNPAISFSLLFIPSCIAPCVSDSNKTI